MAEDRALVRWRALIAALAALCGAAGVALAAVAAHRVPDPSLVTAANFLILHGAAAIGIAALSASVQARRSLLVAATVMIVGVLLFSGDVALRVFFGNGLFPLAAPIGGGTLIVAWLMIAIYAVFALLVS